MRWRWPGALVRLAAKAVMGVGIFVFTVSMLFGVGILMEGVTHRVGEGEVAMPESPQETRDRLAVIGGLVGAAAIGWTLARLGDACRRPGSHRQPRAARLAAELLLLLGGVGLAVGVLVGWGYRLAAYEVGDDYRRVGIGAAVSGPILLGLGWALYRRSARGGAGG